MKDTLLGVPQALGRWPGFLRSRAVWIGGISGALLALFSAGCFYGEPPDRGHFRTLKSSPWSLQTVAPKLLYLVSGWNAFGDLFRADLSRKPDNWDRKELDAVKGAYLVGVVLRGTTAALAFGVNAYFLEADLRRADFKFADLRAARFFATQLEDTNFSDADLRFSYFYESSGRANFSSANVEGAHFDGATIPPANIKEANNWFLAYLNTEIEQALNVCNPDEDCAHNDRLRRKDFSWIDLTRFRPFKGPNLSGANLQHSILRNLDLSEADLSRSDLRNADLDNTQLYGANLAGADLRGVNLKTVRGLTRTQIESALTDTKLKTVLPGYLEAQKPFTPKRQ